jgi:glucose/arabinose dehydrogenase
MADAMINTLQQNNNCGGWTLLNVGLDKFGGVHRGLFKADLSGIPSGAAVTSVEFTVQVSQTIAGYSAGSFGLHRLTRAWGEGTGLAGQGSPAQPDESTWLEAQAGSVAWTTAGGDFDSQNLAATTVSGVGTFSWSGTGLVAAVQDWFTNASGNHGFLLKRDTESSANTMFILSSREGVSPSTLMVGYTPPPLPAKFTSISVSSNLNVVLTWTNDPAAKYDVLYTRNLADTQTWSIAEANIPANTNGLGINIWTDPPYLAGPLFASNNALFYAARSLPASPSGMPVRLQVIASNLVSPVVLTYAPDGSNRLFVCEQRGQVLIVNSSRTLLPAPFLNITSQVVSLNSAYDERGLLGLAFHPGYATNRKFYVYYSAPKTAAGINHESKISEFLCSTTNANVADPISERIVLRFDEPEANHNGGNMTFGPDNYLYISTGDGGGAGDQHPPFGNGQVLTNLLGKILRIDVDGALPYAIPPDNPFTNGPPVRPEIFAYGFRNPWRASFDGTNCWVADVGQNIWEEVDWLHKGHNYGWRIMEGHHPFDANLATNVGVNIPDLEFPIHEYKHGSLGISIIGGFVYRGTNYPALQGRYVFGDFSTSFSTPNGFLHYLEETRINIWERFSFWLAPTGALLHRYVKSFGADQAGEIYLLSTTNPGPSGTSGDIRQLLAP